ncbi:copper-binding protein [Burkholderia cenocepacia]|uniref:copper-binding protein n=1 Tax=Burkholderia cenocepacia TaxID=95486 RepID=UPI0008463ADD|nr:copper-binding protein [Burkholderia cenocepacia]RQU58445.1 RND transporter MFP subunit [Burkholderia cenocepacia]RQV40898.1 RND transporter MFP subunit [Burkholderia cenocepacia]CAB5106672.1 RND family efflux transporter MFP subunit [Burkholderia cenocepacia]CAB5107351.1 RND family efflux transporter MFP subunit [Burkholderia cenocepacia]CAB5107557.1 RND family efflux transporter MFP subunit [Burkholderia cenocepacia]
MKTCFRAVVVSCAMATIAMPALAGGDMPGMNAGGATMSASNATLTDAEVKAIDAGRRLVTLKHGALDNIGMPPMTMAFKAGDVAMIPPLHVGDKVRVRVENVNGTLTIVKLVKRP